MSTTCNTCGNTNSAGCGCGCAPVVADPPTWDGIPQSPPFPAGLVRTRYFDGMVLTQADLENDGSYSRAKRQLTNRALGHGVVWGLRVEAIKDGANVNVGLRVRQGYGIDHAGRDIVVTQPVEVRWDALYSQLPTSSAIKTAGRALLALRYVEVPETLRPPVGASQPPEAWQPARVRETVALTCLPADEVEPPTAALLDNVEDAAGFTSPPMIPTSVCPFIVRVRVGEVVRDLSFSGSGPFTLETLPLVDFVASHRFELDDPPNDTALNDEEPLVVPVYLELMPENGWVFTKGGIILHGAYESATPTNAILEARATPPLAGRIGVAANLEFKTDNLHDRINLKFSRSDDLILVNLWGAPPVRFSGFEVNLQITATPGAHGVDFPGDDSEGSADVVVRRDWHVVASSSSSTATRALTAPANRTWSAFEEPANYLVQNWFTGSGPREWADYRAVALYGLYAWLADANRAAVGASTEGPTGAVVAAQHVLTLAQDLLYGRSLDNVDREDLSTALRNGLASWTDALMSRGVSCPSMDAVILGEVEFSTTGTPGTLLAVHPWRRREYVLTGSTVNHFLTHVGLQTPMSTISRLLHSLSAAAASAGTTDVLAAMPDYNNPTVSPTFNGADAILPGSTSLWTPSGPIQVFRGTFAGVREMLRVQGIQVVGPTDVAPADHYARGVPRTAFELMLQIGRALTGMEPTPGGATRFELHYLREPWTGPVWDPYSASTSNGNPTTTFVLVPARDAEAPAAPAPTLSRSRALALEAQAAALVEVVLGEDADEFPREHTDDIPVAGRDAWRVLRAYVLENVPLNARVYDAATPAWIGPDPSSPTVPMQILQRLASHNELKFRTLGEAIRRGAAAIPDALAARTSIPLAALAATPPQIEAAYYEGVGRQVWTILAAVDAAVAPDASEAGTFTTAKLLDDTFRGELRTQLASVSVLPGDVPQGLDWVVRVTAAAQACIYAADG